MPPYTPTRIPARMLGMYALVADDTDKVYTSDYDWNPALFPYQIAGSNTLFLTFINPSRMPVVPAAFANLAKTRGSGEAPLPTRLY